MRSLKFVALDEEDLAVISTHLQDAAVKVADVIWRPQEKRLVVALDRFDWCSADGDNPEFRRCRAALRFERVSACKCRQLNPAGEVRLVFSGGGVLRLDVECLEAELADLGPAWPVTARPAHVADDLPDDMPAARG